MGQKKCRWIFASSQVSGKWQCLWNRQLHLLYKPQFVFLPQECNRANYCLSLADSQQGVGHRWQAANSEAPHFFQTIAMRTELPPFSEPKEGFWNSFCFLHPSQCGVPGELHDLTSHIAIPPIIHCRSFLFIIHSSVFVSQEAQM